MLKRFLIATLFSLAVSTAYADAPMMIPITMDVSNQPFNLDKTIWGYQFNNKTGKMISFIATVASSSPYPISLQCWHGTAPIETYNVQPGQISQPCVTNDTVRIVTVDDKKSFASGSYTIKVG